MAVDLRELNGLLEYIGVPLPTAAELHNLFVGKQLLFALKSFWCLPLDERSSLLHIIATDTELLRPTRCLMGSKNSMAALAVAVRAIFGDLIDAGRIGFYADDGAGGTGAARAVDDHLDILELVLLRCATRRLRLNPLKLKFFQLEMEHLGKLVRGGALYPAPSMITGLMALSAPHTVADIMTFKGAVQWLSSHLPRLAELLAPIQALETELMRSAKSKSKRVAERIVLGDRWKSEHATAFRAILDLVAKASENYIPTATDRRALFTDASKRAWSGVLLAYPQDEETLPVESRAYRVIGWVGGRWTDTQCKYSIPELEVLATVEATRRFEFYLYEPQGFELYVDHLNMATTFNLAHATDADASAVVAGRVQRWASWFSRFHCTVFHIPGELNYGAD